MRLFGTILRNLKDYSVIRWHLFPVRCLLKSLPLYVLKSHESFTYVSLDVFLVFSKSLTINILQDIVRVSFSAPNASQQCGAFLFVGLSPGLQGALPEPADYKPITKHPSADRPQNPGVCGCPFYKMLIIRVLRQNTPQIFCIVLKWTLPAEWTGRRSDSKEKSSPCAS